MVTAPLDILQHDVQAKLTDCYSKTKLKPHPKSRTRPAANYNLGCFTLWLNRMKREGAKEALVRKLQCENNATSARLRKFLGCGKEMSNATKNLNQAGKKTVNETSEGPPS